MFYVVEFNDGLAIVPSLWLSDDKKFCDWPLFGTQKRIVQAQKKIMVPSNWPAYEVKKVHGHAGMLELVESHIFYLRLFLKNSIFGIDIRKNSLRSKIAKEKNA